MGYQIRYYSEGTERENQGKYKVRRKLFAIGFFLLFLGAVYRLWPDGWQLLRYILIPGDPEITEVSAEVFVSELQAGKPFRDAAGAFLRDILYEGYIY